MRSLSCPKGCAGLIGPLLLTLGLALPPAALASARRTLTPIRHVILIIGENRTFDHLFATYQPPRGERVWNLLSQGIVRADGTPGPKVALARQWQALDTGAYSPDPKRTAPFTDLPAINTDDAMQKPAFTTAAEARRRESGLPAADYPELASGGTGLPNGAVDTRFPLTFANAPIDLSRYLPYDAYAASPVHRLFQMRQELDCSMDAATEKNPSGCRADLFAWVEVTVGAGSNGAPRPADYTEETTHEGPTAMQFLNMARGNAPYFAQLAREYTLSDNFHQAALGGTGANHIMLGFGTLIYYEDAAGRPVRPPAGQIENPDPEPGTNNWYRQDGYGDAKTGGGGSYVECADPNQPGVAAVDQYLESLPYRAFRNGDCKPGAYYLVNNYNPGYLGTGQPAALGPSQFTIPPTRQENLGLLLSRHHVTWKYYGQGWDGGRERADPGAYCNICDPFLYSKQIMTDPALRRNNVGLKDLYADIRHQSLPAVSIVKPDDLLDGHPASSKVDLLEGFVQKIVDTVRATPGLWKDTAIMITFDEGGGFYDQGYVQPIDFFGDGTRVPLIVVSRYSRGGRIVHSYADHVSFDKFVEANWRIHEHISSRSRDNLPNPIASPSNPYVPRNAPAIGDLMDLFDFGPRHGR
ncbi:MAG TPA: alkaline phosphatase family protein [Steroidobacteraceae bacterium]|nr:alkaline phosphatase family protein [Steroidobacteraceae bacterium]